MHAHKELWKSKNHKECSEEIDNYFGKESKNDSVLRPFKSNPFSNNIVLSPLNSVPKKDVMERRAI